MTHAAHSVSERLLNVAWEKMAMSACDLTGRKALVTGGARGLGAGMAEALARAGAAVIIGDVRAELGKATADAVKQTGAMAEFVHLDVTSEPLAIPVPRRVAGNMQPCVPVRLRSVPVRLRSPRLLSCESHA